MSRIQLTDTTQDVLVKMAEGNPGAAMAMMEIIEKHDAIDPQAFMGGIGAIMMFDTWGIYGSDIYILFNDKCGRDVRQVLMLMRAVQLGFLPDSKLRELARDQSGSVNLSDEEMKALDEKVCAELKGFARAA